MTNHQIMISVHEANLLSLSVEIISAASEGETCKPESGLSDGFCGLKLLDKLLPVSESREELGESTTEEGYDDCAYSGRDCDPWS